MFDKSALKLEKINAQVFERLFKQYFLALVSFARKYTRDLDDAKDIVHQVFTNLWEKRDNLHLNSSLRSYLYTAVYYRSLNYIRDRKKMIREDLPDSIESMNQYINYPDFLEQEELRTEIYKALQELPDGCKKIFIASRFEGKKYQEIASEQNISIKTVESQMSKALRILRKKLSDYLVLLGLLLYFIFNN